MRSRRLLITSAIAVASALITLFFYAKQVDYFYAVDRNLKDVRFKARGAMAPDNRVAVVAIDAKSVKELGRWPWDRKVIARLIEGLKEYGAKTIALDIVFSETSNPSSDAALADAMGKSGNVIAGYFFREDEEGKPAGPVELLEPSKIKVVRINGKVESIPVKTFPNVETNIPSISVASANAGFFTILPDRDGIYRSANILLLYEGEMYPSLALSALRHYMGSEIVLDIAPYGVDSLLLGNRRIPVDETGKLTLNYYGQQGIFKRISAVDVIKGRLGRDALKDALVFVGATEIGIYDVRPTPLDPVLPGVEIHATIASNVLQGKFLLRDGRVMILEVAFIMLFPLLLAGLLTLARRTVIAMLVFLGTSVVYFYSDYLPFAHYFLNTAIIFPLISIGLTYLGSEAYRNLVEERQGRFMKKAFTSYVSPALVGEIIKNPGLLKLGGEKREISILFSDIRGFTTLSEKLTPEALVSLLNQYLGPMTDIVLDHKGTLDKYIGDAIMALYNAPLTVEAHSSLACESALMMLERLKDLNRSFVEKGLPEIDIGVGVNTGDVIVGNMGTDVRFDYTAMGDSVNLASRLEGMNKVYKTHIIVSEFTFAAVAALRAQDGASGPGTFRELDLIKVKGKDKPVTIYELSSTLEEGVKKRFEEALTLYRKQGFAGAREIFETLFASGDKVSGIYAERCAEFMDAPPGADWDGVYVAKTK